MKILIALLLLLPFNLTSQKIKLLTSGAKTSLRGLSAVNEKIIWVSGSNGAVARSVDGGASWKWFTVKGFEGTDFRDIEAFDSSTAILMGIAEPAYILKTTDGGSNWKVVYENKTKGIFLDAMDFLNDQNGIVVGDPLNDKFFISRTDDGGNSWKDVNNRNLPTADSDEACFAASGTNIKMFNKSSAYLVSGGLKSRLFINAKSIDMPLLHGKESTGANSLAIKNKKFIIVVGGDFNTPDSTFKNCAITTNNGKTWTEPRIVPHGYRSCVEYISKNNWIACGLNGTDYSIDNGRTWKWISRESYNVCRKAKKGNAVFFAGGAGKIAKLERY